MKIVNKSPSQAVFRDYHAKACLALTLTEVNEELGPAATLGLPVAGDSVGTFRVMVTGQPAALIEGLAAESTFRLRDTALGEGDGVPLGVHGPGAAEVAAMRRSNDMAARPSRNLWLLFPWFVAAAMTMVIAVNCFLTWSALHTFPGNVGGDGFDLSNRYNAIIERMKQEAGLGWALQADVDQAGRPVIVLADRSGTELAGAEIEATVQRPLRGPARAGKCGLPKSRRGTLPRGYCPGRERTVGTGNLGHCRWTGIQHDTADRGAVTALALDDRLDRTAADCCAHCGQPSAPGQQFCCPGCEAAFDAINALGLGSFYERCIAERPPRPERFEPYDLTRFITTRSDGAKELVLAIDGLRCGACVWLIESVLGREPSVLTGRVNMTTRRLRLIWSGSNAEAQRLVGVIESLGYRLIPFDPAALAASRDDTDRALIRALAVAGFAAINVMLLSIGIWAGDAAGLLDGMGPATRDLLHLVSALIALPAIAYAGQPFFRSALAVLRHGQTNMDVPISIGVLLVSGLSLVQTLSHGHDAYFDSAVTLLFFLLIGRVLDHRARSRVRATVEPAAGNARGTST